jgi:chromosome partitioning protein
VTLVLAVINQKGGVGKTTTAANLGAAFARLGHRTLLVDLDPQANLTLHVDQRLDLEAPSVTNLFVDDLPLAGLIRPTRADGLSVVPADTTLAGVEQVLANRIGRETLLREAFERCAELAGFEFVLLDCPPSLGVIAANALVAADRVLIPMQPEFFALQGMSKLLEVVALVRRRLNPTLEVVGIVPCMVDQRTNLANEVVAEIERHFGELATRSRVRSNVKLAEAPSFGRTIFEHAPESNGARDYAALAEELLARLAAGRPAAAPPRAASAAASDAGAPRSGGSDRLGAAGGA